MTATWPPGGLIQATLLRRTLDVGTELWRVHEATRFAPEAFNPVHRPSCSLAGGRFDSVTGNFAHLHAATNMRGALAETFAREVTFPAEHRPILAARLAGRALSQLVTTRPLTLISVQGPGVVSLGAGPWLTGGDEGVYPVSRQWAQAIHDAAAPEAGGLIWQSRHDPATTSVMLWESSAATGIVAGGVSYRLDADIPSAARAITEYLAEWGLYVPKRNA